MFSTAKRETLLSTQPFLGGTNLASLNDYYVEGECMKPWLFALVVLPLLISCGSNRCEKDPTDPSCGYTRTNSPQQQVSRRSPRNPGGYDPYGYGDGYYDPYGTQGSYDPYGGSGYYDPYAGGSGYYDPYAGGGSQQPYPYGY